MLAFKREPGLSMIKSFRVPFNQGEIDAVVLGVATGALLTRTRLDVVMRMKPAAGGNASRNFRVAFYALERSFAPELVATGAVA